MVEALERHPDGPRGPALHGPAPRVAARRAPGVHRGPAGARGSRAGRDPGRRPVRAGARVAAGARPARPARRAWPTPSRTRSAIDRAARGSPSGSGSRICPTSLAAAGYGWTIVDDSHFRAAAIPEDQMWGPYTTEDQGRLISVFGTEQGLRYRIPFQEVDDGHRLPARARHRGRRARRDDGRRRREVRRLAHDVGALLGRRAAGSSASSRRSRRTPTGSRRSGRATGSPRTRRSGASTSRPARTPRWASGRSRPRRSRAFSAALHHARDTGAPEARWLRGAFWRNFQVKYREINDLHKQMLRVVREGRGDGAGHGARIGDGPPVPRASRTTATGTACSAASTSPTCAPRRSPT